MPKTTDRNLLVIGEEEILFSPGKMLLGEMIAAERATGLSWPQIVAGVNSGLMVAVQAIVWLMRKRSNPKLALRDVEFSFEDYALLDPDTHPDYWVLEPGEAPPVADLEETEDEAQGEPLPYGDGGPKASETGESSPREE